jgi:hypothetical protein
MPTETALKIQVAELVSDGIVVGFNDGTSALYSNQLLHEMRARAEELVYDKEAVLLPE